MFCRFSGCNFWSGREDDRAQAVCTYCDTDFVGTDGECGGQYETPESLVKVIDALWPNGFEGSKYVVLTGGEPLLQLDTALIDALHAARFEIAIETNGSLPVPPGVDWVCVSPKVGAKLVVKTGDELKVVVPQPKINLSDYERLGFSHFFVQPMDNAQIRENTRYAIDWCLRHPRWHLSLQTHKILQIP